MSRGQGRPLHRRLPLDLCRLGLWLVLIFVGLLFNPIDTAATTDEKLFRIGFSAKTFTDVNDNDAMAAVKVWAEVIAREQKIPVAASPLVLRGVDEIRRVLRNQDIDALALPTDEYWQVRELLDQRIYIGNGTGDKISQEYVLLVHQESGIERLEDLRGRRLNFMQSSQMSLAPVWLDTTLLQAGFSRASEFCRVTEFPNLSKALLPVFFRQADACVVTRSSFQTMAELNPQISQRLRVLDTSPEMVTSGFCFRRGYDEPIRGKIISELTKIMTSPAGAQVMKLFKAEAFSIQPVSCLDSAFELLATHERLLGKIDPNTANYTAAPAISGGR